MENLQTLENALNGAASLKSESKTNGVTVSSSNTSIRDLDKNNNGHGQGGQADPGESLAPQLPQQGTEADSQGLKKSLRFAESDSMNSESAKQISPVTLISPKIEDDEDDSKENFISGPSEAPARCDIVNQETFLVDVIVSNAVSPLNFSIQSYRESNILKHLEVQMTSWYTAYEKMNHPPLLFKDLSLDSYYALKYRLGDEKSGKESWVRCQIKKPFGESLPILTHLVDHGCYYSTEPKCIRPLRRQYCKMPCQSFDAKLHFVESTKSSFTPEDCHRFHKQVEGKAFCAIVLKTLSTANDNKLTVILVDTSTEKDHYIHHDYGSSKKSNGSQWQ